MSSGSMIRVLMLQKPRYSTVVKGEGGYGNKRSRYSPELLITRRLTSSQTGPWCVDLLLGLLARPFGWEGDIHWKAFSKRCTRVGGAGWMKHKRATLCGSVRSKPKHAVTSLLCPTCAPMTDECWDLRSRSREGDHTEGGTVQTTAISRSYIDNKQCNRLNTSLPQCWWGWHHLQGMPVHCYSYCQTDGKEKWMGL